MPHPRAGGFPTLPLAGRRKIRFARSALYKGRRRITEGSGRGRRMQAASSSVGGMRMAVRMALA